jgi:hypothetical protein
LVELEINAFREEDTGGAETSAIWH